MDVKLFNGEIFKVSDLEEGRKVLKEQLKNWCNDGDKVIFSLDSIIDIVGSKIVILEYAYVETEDGEFEEASGVVRERRFK